MPIGSTNIHIKFNVTEFIMNIRSFVLCELNRVECWN